MQASSLLGGLVGLVMTALAVWWCYNDPVTLADAFTVFYTLSKGVLLFGGVGAVMLSIFYLWIWRSR